MDTNRYLQTWGGRACIVIVCRGVAQCTQALSATSALDSSGASLFRQFTKPTQGNRRLRVVDFVAAVECPDSNARESGSFD